MSKGNWLPYAAIGGWLLALVVGIAWLIESDAVREYPKRDAASYEGKPDWADTFYYGKVDAPTYLAVCQNPQDKEYADLCQQWRVAEVGERTFAWVRAQTIFTILALAGLMATLFYTHLSFRLSASTAQRQLRAYMNICQASIIWKGMIPSAEIVVKNFGVTPAYGFSHVVFIGDEIDVGAVEKKGSQHDAAPHVEYTSTSEFSSFDTAHYQDARNGKYPIYAWGRLEYKDSFGGARWLDYQLVMTNADPKNPMVYSMAPRPEGNRSN